MFGIKRRTSVRFDPVGSRVLRTRASNLGTTLKTCDFCYCRISSTRMVADRHRLAAYHNNHCWRAFRGYQHRWPWTTLNPKNMGFKSFFAILGCDAHLQWIFAETYNDVLFIAGLVAYWPVRVQDVALLDLYCPHVTSGRLAVCYNQRRSIFGSATAFPAATLRWQQSRYRTINGKKLKLAILWPYARL